MLTDEYLQSSGEENIYVWIYLIYSEVGLGSIM